MYLKKNQVVMYDPQSLHNAELYKYKTGNDWDKWCTQNKPDLILMLVTVAETAGEFASAKLLYSSIDTDWLNPGREAQFLLTGDHSNYRDIWDFKMIFM